MRKVSTSKFSRMVDEREAELGRYLSESEETEMLRSWALSFGIGVAVLRTVETLQPQ